METKSGRIQMGKVRERIMSWLKTKIWPALSLANIWSVLSLLFAGYFIWAFHLHAGFPPSEPLTPTAITYLVVFIFFLVLPFAQRLKLGRLIEFEAKVEQFREDVKEVRTDTREAISSVSASVNTISASVNTINQNVTVNLKEEAQVAREELSETLPPPEPAAQEQDIQDHLAAYDADVNLALARLRMDLEGELRRILGRTVVGDPLETQGKFLSARALFRRLGAREPRYRNMQQSFDYVMRACNAAIHGRQIPRDIAYETIGVGLRILGELTNEAELPH